MYVFTARVLKFSNFMFRLETTESSSARGGLVAFAEDTGLTLRTHEAPHSCL